MSANEDHARKALLESSPTLLRDVETAARAEAKQEDFDHEIADDLLTVLRRFIGADSSQHDILALWILHTHCFLETCSYTPYLAITSAEKGSGKTRVLEVLKPLVRSPLMTASISPAALARIVDKDRPTLLLDEYDAAFKGEKKRAEMLRGILNGGFHAAGAYTRLVGRGAALKPQSFATFCPKVLAGIGNLPDTIASRSVIIRLKRVQRGQCEPFRPDGMGQSARSLRAHLQSLQERAAGWGARHSERIANSEPICPDQFSDRQHDISEPLFAISDLLGGAWPVRARLGLLKVFSSAAAEDTSKRARVLADIRQVFLEEDREKLPTAELIAKLCELEDSPWSEWNHGKQVTPYQLARLLKDFEIGPRIIRDPNPTRGYLRESFLDPWSRYLPPLCSCGKVCKSTCNSSQGAVTASLSAGCNALTREKGGIGQNGHGNSSLF